MREILRELYSSNRKAYELLNYLWVFSDSKTNSIEFNRTIIRQRFGISESGFTRMLSLIEELNREKAYLTIERVQTKIYIAKFYSSPKKIEAQVCDVYSELFEWVKNFYEDVDYDYVELNKHKKYIKTICNKISKSMNAKGDIEVDDDSLKDSFKIFFNNIPEWWRENAFTLPTINKNYTKILNNIKNERVSKKSDKYNSAVKEVEQIDFSKFTKNNK